MHKFIPLCYLGLMGTLGLPTDALAQGAPAKPAAKPATPVVKPVVAKPAAASPKPAAPATAKPAAVSATPTATTPVADPAPAPAPAARQAPTGPAVHYAVSFPNAVHHEARVKATFSGLTPGKTLTVRMAR